MQQKNKRKRVIFDNDIGIDDAMALLFLHYSPEVDLVAITTVFGNASLEDVTRNALFVKEKFGISAPVYPGASIAIGPPLGKLEGDDYPDFVHGKNGLGDIPVPELEQLSVSAETKTADQAIIDILRANPGEISIVSVGRLTNLANALQQDPEIAVLAKELVIMGGVFGYNGHRGNVSPVAEANIAGDPTAADMIATSGINTTFVGLDVTEETRMDEGFINNLRQNAGEAGEFIYQISRHYFGFYHQLTGQPECPVHDSSAVAYLLRPELYQTKKAVIRVVTEGFAAGQTIAGNLDGNNANYVSNAWSELNSKPLEEHRFCTNVDAAAVLDLYTQTLISA